ncbi:MAG: SlyX family protein [Rhodospirillaceae bacterium]|jgi:SlyX protein|nr:SlyX family protein [Rhodospirillaceae bacterium]MBT4218796.1 SlyX family protein [Rhodospirillaceae bacterium]MBT4464237.1 SlyX family protein [Rhodospirillaceae bacterium]MBT5308188.1 SlyX family protein [Rhodospirillaceae bacterium]MBT6406644.1 SlyX family protein [Rhodospirillaceae bacterium]
MSETTDERLNRLEEAFAHQDTIIGDLSDEIAKQWKTLEALVRKMAELEEKLEGVEDAMPTPAADVKPPHY